MYDEGPYPIETKQIIGLVSIWWGPLSWKIFSIFKNFAKYFFDSIEKVFSNIKFSAKTTCVPSFNLIPSILSTTDQEQSELIGKKKKPLHCFKTCYYGSFKRKLSIFSYLNKMAFWLGKGYKTILKFQKSNRKNIAQFCLEFLHVCSLELC